MSETAPKNIYLFSGTDEASFLKEAEKLVKELAGEDPDPFLYDHLRENEETKPVDVLGKTISAVLSPPFFGGPKVVYLQNFSGFSNEPKKTDKSQFAVEYKKLCDVIGKGIGSDIVLVMSGAGIDKRKGLYKACNAAGTVKLFEKPDVKDRNWQESMTSFIRKAANDKGMNIGHDVCEFLVQAIGAETSRVESELEKLLCYCGGPGEKVTVKDAREICSGKGEAISWSLLDSAGARNVTEALDLLNVLLEQSKDPEGDILGLVLQLAGRYRQLLQIRVFMQKTAAKSARRVQDLIKNASREQKVQWGNEGFEFVNFHPFRAFKLAEQAMNYSGPELVEALAVLRDANWKCVSAGVSKRIVMEDMLVRLLSRKQRAV